MTWVLLLFVVALALNRLLFALPHAIADLAPWSAVNVAYRHDELTRWFAGDAIYRSDFGRLTYPPASYVLLWPILGWLPLSSARILYVVTTIIAAVVAALLMYRVAMPHPGRLRLLIVAVLAASYPLQASIFLGHVMPFMVVALVAAAAALLHRQPSLRTDVAAAACLAASLIKPTLAPPLVAAVLIHRPRWRPAILTVAFYAAAAAVASMAQPGGIVLQHMKWLHANNAHSVAVELGAALPNMHGWLSMVGLGQWGPVASLLILAAFCVWLIRTRGADVWVLLGAAALIARLWSYHRPYDDAVIFLAVLALLRVTRAPDPRLRTPATALLAAACAALLTPSWALYDLAPSAIAVVYAVHTLLWVVLLAFLLVAARQRTAVESSDLRTAAAP